MNSTDVSSGSAPFVFSESAKSEWPRETGSRELSINMSVLINACDLIMQWHAHRPGLCCRTCTSVSNENIIKRSIPQFKAILVRPAGRPRLRDYEPALLVASGRFPQLCLHVGLYL